MALFSYGFRPFFLFSGLWVAVVLPVSIAAIFRWFDLPTTMAPASWHAHELLFGYAAAVVAGFLLTTVPNWTGRLPLRGWGLAGLAGLCLAGRVPFVSVGVCANAVTPACGVLKCGCGDASWI